MIEVTSETVANDRERRNMSRRAYAELTGLTEARIMNIEKGRVPKPDEVTLLAPWVTGTGDAAPLFEDLLEIAAEDGIEPPVVIDDDDDDDENAMWVEGEQLSIFDAPVQPPAPELVMNTVPEDDEPIGGVATRVGIVTKYKFKLDGYHLSNSEIQTFKRCRRKWWLTYYRELRLKRKEVVGPRAIGTRIHLALSGHYSDEQLDAFEILEDTIAYDRAILSEGTDIEALDTFDKEADLARAMLEGFMEWVSEEGIDDGLEVVGNEEVVEVPLGMINTTNVILIGKMDLRVRRTIDNARLFLDWKTVQNLTTPTKTLHLDEQMLYYHLLEYLDALACGTADVHEFAAGGLYSMLRKVKRSAKATPPFYGRVEVRHNIHELRSFYIRVFGEATAIIELRDMLDAGADHRQVAFPSPRSECAWDCDFILVCPMFDDGSAAEELLAEYYEKSDPHDHYYPMGEREDERTQ